MKKLAIALLTPYQFKNKLRRIQPQIFEKIKNCQPELEFTDSYKKKRVQMCYLKKINNSFVFIGGGGFYKLTTQFSAIGQQAFLTKERFPRQIPPIFGDDRKSEFSP